jgi:stalled ribosome alternative rescue factor ArfA
MIRLLLKTHNKTGLKYLCQTSQEDYHRYPGSGVYWRRHLSTHGWDWETQVLKECTDKEQVTKWGAYYSDLWNVVDSPDYANLVKETGNGMEPEYVKNLWKQEDFRSKVLKTRKTTFTTEEYKRKQSEAGKKVWADLEYRANRRDQSGRNNPRYDPTPHTFIHKDGTKVTLPKYDFAEEYNLRHKAVRHLVAGDTQTHKGWKVEKKENTDYQ